VTTNKHNTFAYLHTLQITTANTKSSIAFTSRCLVAVSNNTTQVSNRRILPPASNRRLLSRDSGLGTQDSELRTQHSLFTIDSKSTSKLKLLCYWRFTANQFVLASSPLRITTRIFFSQLNPCSHSPYVTSLWREDGSVVHNSRCPSPKQSFSGPSSTGLMTTFYLRLPLTPKARVSFTLPLSYESQSHVTTDGQSASLSWNEAPIWDLRPDLYYCQTVAGLLMWGALSDERTGLSFARVTVSSNKSVVRMYNLHFTCY
jgi:hypothetical protein